MLLNRDVWSGRHLPMLEADKGAASGAGTEGDQKAGTESDKGKQGTDTSADTEKLGEAGLAALQKERDAREAAEKEAKRLRKIVDDAEAAARQREADEAKAKGDFEKLANDRQEEINRLKAEIAQKEHESLKAKIGAAHKLPDALIDVLKGETEAELTAHAKELAKHVKPPVAADTESGDKHLKSATTSTTKADGTTQQTPNYSFLPPNAKQWPN